MIPPEENSSLKHETSDDNAVLENAVTQNGSGLEQIGLTPSDIKLLDSGMSVERLLAYICAVEN